MFKNEEQIERGLTTLHQSKYEVAANRVFGNRRDVQAIAHIVSTIFNEDEEREIRLVKSTDRDSINIIFLRPMTAEDERAMKVLRAVKTCIANANWQVGYRITKARWNSSMRHYFADEQRRIEQPSLQAIC